MNTNRPCGCKGVRSCLQCESAFRIEKPILEEELRKPDNSWSFCLQCDGFQPGWCTQLVNDSHAEHDEMKPLLRVPGIHIVPNFLSPEECVELMHDLDTRIPWCISQSGRRKQNFGPKTNFKRRKLKLGDFRGFPDFTEFLQTRFCSQIPLLANFRTVEQCSLEYSPENGSSIDPHIDDCWIWGERVLTINCLGDSVLTLTPFPLAISDETMFLTTTKYNLDCLSEYKDDLLSPLWSIQQMANMSDQVLRIPMPSGSLMVLYGPLRYQFEHCVLRSDVTKRRVCIAYRELTTPYLKNDGGPYFSEGDAVLRQAEKFWPTTIIQQ